MLEMRPSCECCDVNLPPQSAEAFVCSFECTFCQACAETKLGLVCPGCDGELSRRPTRTGAQLRKYPASTVRVFKLDHYAPR